MVYILQSENLYEPLSVKTSFNDEPWKKYVMISKKYNQNYLPVLFYYLPVVDLTSFGFSKL